METSRWPYPESNSMKAILSDRSYANGRIIAKKGSENKGNMGEGSATNLWVNVSLRASFPDPLIESEGMLDRGIHPSTDSG